MSRVFTYLIRVFGRGDRNRTRSSPGWNRVGGFEDRCAATTLHPYLATFTVAFNFSYSWFFLFAFIRNSTLIISLINTIIILNSVFFTLVEFCYRAILHHVSSEPMRVGISIFLHLSVLMSVCAKRGEVLFSSKEYILGLANVDLPIS